MTMATISGEEKANVEATLQQLKAKKNKSNLFLIKSYSFIDKTNNNNKTFINNNNNNNKLLRSPDREAFSDIADSLSLAQEPTKKARLKVLQPKKQPKTSKSRREREREQEQEAQLLRRNAHEYNVLPRPQSLPGKVQFEAAEQAVEKVHPTLPKRRGNNNNKIKRESFLRQSLQSIRRSFGSSKHSSKPKALANGQSVVTPLPSPACSSNASTSSSSTSSSTKSSYSSSTAISLLSKAQAQNHRLDEFLPTPVVLLLNDDLGQHSDISDNGVYAARRSTSSVVCTTTNNTGNNSGTDDRATTSMAPPQLPTTLPTPTTATATATTLNEQELQREQQQQQQRKLPLQQQQQQLELHLKRQQYGTIQLPLPETFGPQNSSLPQSYSSSVGLLQSSGSAQSLGSSPSPSPRNSESQSRDKEDIGVNGLSAGHSNNTAKQHEQKSSAVAGISSTSAAAAGVNLNGGISGGGGSAGIATYTVAAGSSVTVTPPEKQKKRKEVSSSRVKKFHRHFSQVSKDEKLINYFSCALVGDIPLQGHLYITEEHFAFYSNVFGYVTKVVIPTSSVTKISKEKTAKIIPNAVGVATADERHVFGSFISRESAFRLMCTVCTQLNPCAEILLPKPLRLPVDVELTEEYLIDDDSSCSISGNESPPQLRDPAARTADLEHEQKQALLRQRHSEVQAKISLDVIDGPLTIRSSAPATIVRYEDPMQQQQLSSPGAGSRQIFSSALPSVMGSASGASGSSGAASSSSSPVTVVGMGVCGAVPTTPINTGAGDSGAAAVTPLRSRWRIMTASARTRLSLDVPALTELQVLYLGITLAVLLAIFSVFLLYRVLDIEAKTSLYNMPVDFNARGGNDDDIFAEALRWQKELQDRSTAEAQHILAKNLEQISKVRRSLETLSMLIHDRRDGYAKPQAGIDLMGENGAAASDVSD